MPFSSIKCCNRSLSCFSDIISFYKQQFTCTSESTSSSHSQCELDDRVSWQLPILNNLVQKCVQIVIQHGPLTTIPMKAGISASRMVGKTVEKKQFKMVFTRETKYENNKPSCGSLCRAAAPADGQTTELQDECRSVSCPSLAAAAAVRQPTDHRRETNLTNN
jgi:hypothetical protein